MALDTLTEIITHIINKNKFEILLIGDFNADTRNKSKPPARALRQFAAEVNLQQLIVEVTRATKKTRTTIDLAFSNINYCTKTGTLNYNISEHQPVYIIKKKPRNSLHKGRSYHNCIKKAIADEIHKLNTEAILKEKDPNKAWELMSEILESVADKLCPVVEKYVGLC